MYNRSRMLTDFDRMLRTYAELTVRIALNLQPGQRLLIIGPLANGGCSLEAAPLVRQIADRGIRRRRAACRSAVGRRGAASAAASTTRRAIRFDEFSAWLPGALVDARRGGARGALDLCERSRSAEGLAARACRRRAAGDRARRAARSASTSHATRPIGRVVAAAAAGLGGTRLSGSARRPSGDARLWDAIERLCRLDRPDPIAAWETHLAELAARARSPQRAAIHGAAVHAGPGTDLTIGLAARPRLGRAAARPAVGHPRSRRTCRPRKCSRCRTRIASTARCASTKPLSYGGTLIEGFSLTFARGRVVEREGRDGARRCCASWWTPTPARPGSAKWRSCRTARRSRSPGVLFYNTLFDENAASHVALGAAYKFTLRGGETMSDERVRGGRRQPQRHPRRLHDRVAGTRHRRRAGRRQRRAAHAARRVGIAEGQRCGQKWSETGSEVGPELESDLVQSGSNVDGGLMRTRVAATALVIAFGIGFVAAQAQSRHHLNPMIDLLEQKKPQFGVYWPGNPQGRRGGPPPPGAVMQSPSEWAKQALAYPDADFLFNGSMEGGVDRAIAGVTDFIKAMPRRRRPRRDAVLRASRIRSSSRPRRSRPTRRRAAENIGRELNLGVSGIMFVGTSRAPTKCAAGIAAMRFKSNGGTRPDDVGSAPAVLGHERAASTSRRPTSGRSTRTASS